METKKPSKTKQLTQKIVSDKRLLTRVLAVSLVVVAVLTLGIFTIVLSTQTVHFGQPNGQALVLGNLKDIQAHATPTRSHQVFTDSQFLSTRPSYRAAAERIVYEINNAGRTNRLSQIFQYGGTEHVTVNTTNTVAWNIRNNSNHHFLRLTFMTPQWSIRPTEGGGFAFYPADTNANGTVNMDSERNVWQIFIILSSVGNYFAEHNWYISTRPEPIDNIRYRFVTWANYYELANFVTELDLLNQPSDDDEDDNDTEE